MVAPRLIKVTCPECGAALRVDTGASVVTCAYCRKSSFVHWPNRPAQPTTAPNYGHIHVPAKAMRTMGAVVVISVLVPVLIMACVVAALVFSGRGKTSVVLQGSPEKPTFGASGGPSCERAVACCKAIQPQNTGCEGLRLMSEADCSQQIDALSTAAKAIGRSCN